jgi:hypothetical protein
LGVGQTAFLLKHFYVDGFSFYWLDASWKYEEVLLSADEEVAGAIPSLQMEDYILLPLSCTIKLQMSNSEFI